MKFLDNAFAKSLANKYCSKNDSKDTDDSSSDEEIEIRAPKSGVRNPPVVDSNPGDDDDRYADASSVSSSDESEVEENINLELADSLVLANNLELADDSLDPDDSSADENDSSDKENDSDSAKTRAVGPSEHLRCSAKYGKLLLNKWLGSGEHTPVLDTLVEELIQKYKTTISEADMKEIFSYMSREKKFEWVIKLITDKYPIDEEDMRGGCEVYRAYHEKFPRE
jgi:hypothetical protein